MGAKLESESFPFPVKIIHALTGHIYIRPISNLKPFTEYQEKFIEDYINSCNLGIIRNKVKSNFTTEPTKQGYGFRIYTK
jgi:hypothetical protein